MTEAPQERSESSRPSMLPSILAIGGAIILLVIIVWGIVHLAGLSLPWFSSLWDRQPEITVHAPETVQSGTVFTLSWQFDTPEAGRFAFLYECTDHIQIGIPTTEGSYSAVPCGAAVSLGSDVQRIELLPLYVGEEDATTVTLSVLFVSDAADATGPKARGTATVRVRAAVPQPEVPHEPQEEPHETPPPPPTTAPARGPADLVVTISSVTVDGYGNGVATFTIANRGGSPSGTYYFTAQLPTSQPYTYSSPAQASLAPGAYVVNTLRFTQALTGIFSVSVDPAQHVRESNESNNTASQSVIGSYAPYGSYQTPMYGGTPQYSY